MSRRSTLLTLSLFTLVLSTSAQNQALSLNGTTDYVTTGAYVVPTSGDFTVEFWANLATLQAGLHEFVSQGTGTTNGFYIGYDGGGNIRCGDLFMSTATPVPVNQWFHLALVNSGGTATLYVNGVQKATHAGYSIASGSSFFRIGQQFAPYDEKMPGIMDEVRVWSVARTADQIKKGLYGVNVAAAGLVAWYKMDGDLTNSTATAGLDGAPQGSPAFVSSPVQTTNNSLNFDGVNDQVTAPGTAAYDLTAGTIEVLINPTTLSGTAAAIVGVRTDGLTATRFSFHVSATQLGMWNGSTFATINYAVPTNTWTHLAYVYDGTNVTVYANGVATPVGTFNQAFGTAPLATLAFGVSKNGGGGDNEYFNGNIDEVRIWNTQRTPSEILANKDIGLTGTEAGLVALFNFDQGVTDGDNSHLITAFDNTVATNNATLSGFSLTAGTASNFVTSPLAPVILPVTFLSFNAIAKDDQAYLQWQTAQEQNSAEFIIERSTDGSNYTAIGSVAAAGESHLPLTYSFTDVTPAQGLNYYRLKEKDLDGKFMYSQVRVVSFNYTGPTKIAWSSIGAGATEFTLLPGNNEIYSVIDLNGHRLQQGRLSGGKLYLSGMAAGIYFINITTSAGKQMNTKVLVR
jgi:hypothetical protein